MSKMKFSKGKFSKFISSKGFYAALALCLVGASAATWVAVNRTISGIEDANSQLLESEFSEFPLLEEAERLLENVPRVYLPPSSSSTASSPSPEPVSEPEEPSDEQVLSPVSPTLAYVLPARGQIMTSYSQGELIKNVTLGDWRTHDGVDIAATKGDDIYAAADGVVTSVDSSPLWSTVVTIRHSDGHESIYSGLASNVSVQVGENVLARQVIGKLDGVPCEISEESHLHFAMRKDGKWVDPLSVIAKA